MGHSDADVLSHAICDALLGAAGLGDIGQHFPDSDPEWKGVSSLNFLAEVKILLHKHGFDIVNLDSVVVLDQPKLAPHIPAIRESLATTLRIEPSAVSVKAKTSEGVSPDMAAAQAIVLLVKMA